MLRDVFLVFLYYLNELEVFFFAQNFTGDSKKTFFSLLLLSFAVPLDKVGGSR
jgi:hypothetical protein